MKKNDSNIKNIPTLVTACCVLHNLCELQGDACEEDWVLRDTQDSATTTGATAVSAAVPTPSSTRIREAPVTSLTVTNTSSYKLYDHKQS